MTAQTAKGAHRTRTDSRHQAREAALQMLYQSEVGRISIAQVSAAFWDGPSLTASLSESQRTFATQLAGGVAAATTEIDPLISAAAEHWRVERMNVLDRLVLRLAVYEFLHERETPAKVIINEALELARTFCGDESVRFVNGILDAIRREHDRV